MKVSTSVSIKAELHALAKKEGLVLSKFLEESLEKYLQVNKASIEGMKDLEGLKEKIIEKTTELNMLLEQKKNLKTEVDKKKEEDGEWIPAQKQER